MRRKRAIGAEVFVVLPSFRGRKVASVIGRVQILPNRGGNPTFDSDRKFGSQTNVVDSKENYWDVCIRRPTANPT